MTVFTCRHGTRTVVPAETWTGAAYACACCGYICGSFTWGCFGGVREILCLFCCEREEKTATTNPIPDTPSAEQQTSQSLDRQQAFVPSAILLAGGNGTRLAPLTTVVNKHLLPIGNKPMIMHAIDRLVEWGIRKVVLVTRQQDAGAFRTLLGDGSSVGLERLNYVSQSRPNGIVGAMQTAMATWPSVLVRNDVVVMLGDNLFSPGVLTLDHLRGALPGSNSAGIVVATDVPARVKRQSGVLTTTSLGELRFVEKPELPECQDAVVTGLYYFDATVQNRMLAVSSSERGELEITDLLEQYLETGALGITEVKAHDWTDAGMDIETYYRAITALRASIKFYHPRFPGEEK